MLCALVTLKFEVYPMWYVHIDKESMKGLKEIRPPSEREKQEVEEPAYHFELQSKYCLHNMMRM